MHAKKMFFNPVATVFTQLFCSMEADYSAKHMYKTCTI